MKLANKENKCPNCGTYWLRKSRLNHKECENCGAEYYKENWG